MSGGVSVGWFTPAGMYADPPFLINAIKKTHAERMKRTKAWPFAVSSIRFKGKGVGVAYAHIGGSVPVHVDSVGMDDSDGRIFQFVLETENRPALITSPVTDQNTPVIQGFAPPTGVNTFGMGGMELKAGMAVHFDITTTYHGIIGLPVPMESLRHDLSPKAVIVQVSGFGPTEIGLAVEHASEWIQRDISASLKRTFVGK